MRLRGSLLAAGCLASAAILDPLFVANARSDTPGNAAGETCPRVVVSNLAVGEHHACAVVGDGRAECWGQNIEGQLGSRPVVGACGTDACATIPEPIATGHRIVATALGSLHSCALLENEHVACWGWNGNGQTGARINDNGYVPKVVNGLRDVTGISVNSNDSCALLRDATVRCWGYNGDGELGVDPATTPASATPVEPPVADAVAISVGPFHVCAVLASGTIACWGYNGTGQLGNGTVNSGPTPTPGLVVGIDAAVEVAAGADHTCALLADGSVACWGSNEVGQLGNGTNTSSTTPVVVPGLSNVVTLVSKLYHTCALLGDGQVACWGNIIGPTPTIKTELPPALSVGVGIAHNCALLVDGRVECWGVNSYGELGDGTTVESWTPVEVLLH